MFITKKINLNKRKEIVITMIITFQNKKGKNHFKILD